MWKMGASHGRERDRQEMLARLALNGMELAQAPDDMRGNLQMALIIDGRNRAIVIAESLASLSLRFESLAFVGGHISPQNTEISPHRPCVRCAAIRIARLAFIHLRFVPRGIAEWRARLGCVS